MPTYAEIIVFTYDLNEYGSTCMCNHSEYRYFVWRDREYYYTPAYTSMQEVADCYRIPYLDYRFLEEDLVSLHQAAKISRAHSSNSGSYVVELKARTPLEIYRNEPLTTTGYYRIWDLPSSSNNLIRYQYVDDLFQTTGREYRQTVKIQHKGVLKQHLYSKASLSGDTINSDNYRINTWPLTEGQQRYQDAVQNYSVNPFTQQFVID